MIARAEMLEVRRAHSQVSEAHGKPLDTNERESRRCVVRVVGSKAGLRLQVPGAGPAADQQARQESQTAATLSIRACRLAYSAAGGAVRPIALGGRR